MAKLDKKILNKGGRATPTSKNRSDSRINTNRKRGRYRKNRNFLKGGRRNYRNRPKHGKSRRPMRRFRYPFPTLFGYWKDPNPRTNKEKRNKRVRNLVLTNKGLRVSRIVNQRFRLQKGVFVLYKYGMSRFFRKVQFYRKTNNFIMLKKTANNFFVTVFRRSGLMLFYTSAGMLNLKGPRRSTTEAAERVISSVCKRLRKAKIKNIGLIIKSPNGRVMKSAVRRLNRLYRDRLNTLVLFMIPRSHNGIRGKKIKRG
jgi:ribosomal protein S11